MNSEAQREALAILAEVWALSPDVRLGQLLAHLGFLGEAHFGQGLGYIDDDELMSVLRRHRVELLARLPDMSSRALEPTGTAIPGSRDSTVEQP